MQRFIKIDGKVRTDITYPTGFMGELGLMSEEGKGWVCSAEGRGV
jgi:ribosomal protein S4E